MDIKVPEMGESITEATIAEWRFQKGEGFASGDELVELETDKANTAIPAPAGGVLTEILAEAGAVVEVGQVIARMEEGAVGAAPSSDPGSETASPETEASSGGAKTVNAVVPPGARRLAAESGVDPARIPGSGKRGQVTKADVIASLEGGNGGRPAAPPPSAPPPSSPPPAARPAGERETIVPMTRLRKRIAERLLEAQKTAAILTTFNEVDMHAVMEARSRWKEKFKEKYEVSLGFMSFFVKASTAALREYPGINAEIQGENIVYKNYYDIGVAVGGPRGLVVPIVRDADLLSFAGIEREINRLALRVREGTIEPGELMNGTFTISNGGVYGSLLSTPILNPPQSGILGMHNIVKRPVVIDDEIKIRPMMYIALSYDHRIVDGKEAVSFLVRVKESLENPERLLLEI